MYDALWYKVACYGAMVLGVIVLVLFAIGAFVVVYEMVKDRKK